MPDPKGLPLTCCVCGTRAHSVAADASSARVLCPDHLRAWLAFQRHHRPAAAHGQGAA